MVKRDAGGRVPEEGVGAAVGEAGEAGGGGSGSLHVCFVTDLVLRGSVIGVIGGGGGGGAIWPSWRSG